MFVRVILLSGNKVYEMCIQPDSLEDAYKIPRPVHREEFTQLSPSFFQTATFQLEKTNEKNNIEEPKKKIKRS